jgi:hypothetical protein
VPCYASCKRQTVILAVARYTSNCVAADACAGVCGGQRYHVASMGPASPLLLPRWGCFGASTAAPTTTPHPARGRRRAQGRSQPLSCAQQHSAYSSAVVSLCCQLPACCCCCCCCCCRRRRRRLALAAAAAAASTGSAAAAAACARDDPTPSCFKLLQHPEQRGCLSDARELHTERL